MILVNLTTTPDADLYADLESTMAALEPLVWNRIQSATYDRLYAQKKAFKAELRRRGLPLIPVPTPRKV